jgi:putative glutamine amidotransferase
MKPVVLVSADRRDGDGLPPGQRSRPARAEVWVGEAYVAAVRAAGGLPILAPPGEEDVEGLLALAEGVVLTGGHFDIHPSHYGEEVQGRLDRVEPSRTELEIRLARECLSRGVPLLGICGGMQAMCVAAGGRLVQDLPKPDGRHAGQVDHEQPTDPATPHHAVSVAPPASRWLGERVLANSTHHQAVREPGDGLVACGHSEDGVIEVIAAVRGTFALGVQWHPELLGDVRPYRALVDASRAR